MTTTITVTDDQVESAKALIDISGGPDKVDPLIVKIASAKPKGRADADRTFS